MRDESNQQEIHVFGRFFRRCACVCACERRMCRSVRRVRFSSCAPWKMGRLFYVAGRSFYRLAFDNVSIASDRKNALYVERASKRGEHISGCGFCCGRRCCGYSVQNGCFGCGPIPLLSPSLYKIQIAVWLLLKLVVVIYRFGCCCATTPHV
jgi:hypothetical protein